MKKAITERQKQLLEIIYQYIKDTGYPPSFAEMKDRLGVASNQSVIDLLTKLEKQGIIKKNEYSARSISILPIGLKILGKQQILPIVGASSAGSFVESYADIFDKWVTLPNVLMENEKIQQAQDNVFVIQVYGDSMINAGIDNGDILLVKKDKEFKSGDIVVARSEEGTTVKRFIADGGKRYLKPENPNYQNIPIIPGEIKFDGKVILNLSKVK